MFSSFRGLAGFIAGVALTVGLLLSPHLIPGGYGYGRGYTFTPLQVAALALAGLAVLAVTLWIAGRLLRGAQVWNEPRVIAATLLIAFNANALYVVLVDFYALNTGLRALVAVCGVPVIYGNLAAVLGRQQLKDAMAGLFSGALATMGAGYIIAALVRGW
jgi:hypothetical protein